MKAKRTATYTAMTTYGEESARRKWLDNYDFLSSSAHMVELGSNVNKRGRDTTTNFQAGRHNDINHAQSNYQSRTYSNIASNPAPLRDISPGWNVVQNQKNFRGTGNTTRWKTAHH